MLGLRHVEDASIDRERSPDYYLTEIASQAQQSSPER
jgi:hypothetical protein